MNIRLLFAMPGSPGHITAPGLEVCMDAGRITVRVFTDFRSTPLLLEAAAAPGVELALILIPHRIELCVNGEVADEEWPAGKLLFGPECAVNSSVPVDMAEYVPPCEELPCVTGVFTGAEGWRPGGNVFVGDCMPYVDSGRYHVLYLKDRRHHRSKWGLGAHQWEHISTDDFVTWQTHPMAVAITDPMEGSICTGSWIRKGDTHYLFYTIRMADGSPARICRSLSRDGYHFEKDSDFAFLLTEKYHGPSARDPKIVLDEDGLYHMFLTTSLSAESKGCLAHLTSPDLDTWTEADEPIFTHTDENQPECPDYFKSGDYYYLIYSLHGYALYMYSDKPFSGWRVPADPRIPCEAVPKAGIWNGRIVFTGFERINGYAGTLTFKTASAAENGELVFN